MTKNYITLLLIVAFSIVFSFDSFGQTKESELEESTELILALSANKDLTLSQKLKLKSIDSRIKRDNLGQVAYNMLNFNLYQKHNIGSGSEAINRLYVSPETTIQRIHYEIDQAKRIENDIKANKWLGKKTVEVIGKTINYGIADKTIIGAIAVDYGVEGMKNIIEELNYTQYRGQYDLMIETTSTFFKRNTSEGAIRKFADGPVTDQNLAEKSKVVNELLIGNEKFSKLKNEEKIDLLNGYQSVIVGFIDENLEKLKNEDAEQDQKIKNNFDAIVDLNTNLNKVKGIAIRNTERINRIGEKVSKLSNYVNQNSISINDNRNDIMRIDGEVDVIKLTLFSKLPPKEKKQWLQSKMINVPNDSTLTVLLNDIEEEISRDESIELAADIKKYCVIGTESINILNNIGILDAAVAQDLNKAIGFASGISDMASAYLTGNYGAMLSGISSMAFGGGKSTDQKRFEQMMSFLKGMDVKLDTIISNQHKIMKGIVGLQKTLVKIDSLNEVRYRDLKVDISLINTKVNVLTEDINLLLKTQYLNDIKFLVEAFNRYEDNFEVFKSEVTVENHKTEATRNFNNLFNSGNSDISLQSLLTYESSRPENSNFSKATLESEIHKFQSQYLELLEIASDSLGQIHLLSKLSLPSNDLAFLDSTYQKIELFKELNLPFNSSRYFGLDDFIHLESLFELIYYSTEFSEIQLLWNKSGKFYLHPLGILDDPNHLIGKKSNTKAFLEQSLKWINLAIVQQNLISGDVLLPFIYDNRDNQNLTAKFLTFSELLNQNYAHYIVDKRVREKGFTGVSYEMAFSSKSINGIENLVNRDYDDNFEIKESPQGWLIKIGNDIDGKAIYCSLPSPKEFKSRAINLGFELNILLDEKSKVISYLSEYELQNDLRSTRKAIYDLYSLTSQN